MDHIRDEVLAAKMQELATERACIICGRTGGMNGPPFGELLAEVSAALHRHYVDAEFEGVPWDSEDDCYAGALTYETSEAIEEICGGAFTDDFSGVLTEKVSGAFPADITWTDTRDQASFDALDWGWAGFAQTVQSRSRFIFIADSQKTNSRMAPGTAEFLARLARYANVGLDLIEVLEPGAVFWRGRLMDTPQSLDRERNELQPPPPDQAAANRMSPAGIPMFYAAADPQTAIAEIAGHGPQPYVLMGAFCSTRQLRLLDLTRTPAFPSYFDEAQHEELGLARFLRSFVRSITQPVIPDGRQHIAYTPTQVLTEYLRWMPENPIDGIALPSAQTGEKTYVLFFDSTAFADAGQDPPARPLTNVGIPASPDAAFTLDKDDILVYQVKRSYEAVPYG